MQSVELQLPVAATLPAGYLCCDTRKVLAGLFPQITITLFSIPITRGINEVLNKNYWVFQGFHMKKIDANYIDGS